MQNLRHVLRLSLVSLLEHCLQVGRQAGLVLLHRSDQCTKLLFGGRGGRSCSSCGLSRFRRPWCFWQCRSLELRLRLALPFAFFVLSSVLVLRCLGWSLRPGSGRLRRPSAAAPGTCAPRWVVLFPVCIGLLLLHPPLTWRNMLVVPIDRLCPVSSALATVRCCGFVDSFAKSTLPRCLFHTPRLHSCSDFALQLVIY